MNGFAGTGSTNQDPAPGGIQGDIAVLEGNVIMSVDNVCVCEVEWFPMLLTAVINLANLANSTLH